MSIVEQIEAIMTGKKSIREKSKAIGNLFIVDGQYDQMKFVDLLEGIGFCRQHHVERALEEKKSSPRDILNILCNVVGFENLFEVSTNSTVEPVFTDTNDTYLNCPFECWAYVTNNLKLRWESVYMSPIYNEAQIRHVVKFTATVTGVPKVEFYLQWNGTYSSWDPMEWYTMEVVVPKEVKEIKYYPFMENL